MYMSADMDVMKSSTDTILYSHLMNVAKTRFPSNYRITPAIPYQDKIS